jgi:hypothetical protein
VVHFEVIRDTIYHNIGEQGKQLIEGTFEQIRNAKANGPA